MLAAQHDDDDIYIYIYIYLCVCVCVDKIPVLLGVFLSFTYDDRF